jgi:hypothetical protein
MNSEKGPRPYLNPYVAGALLGAVLFAAFFLTGSGLGASAAFSRVQVGLTELFAQDHVDKVGYFAELGGGGRRAIAHPSVWMLLGTIAGGALSGLANRRFRPEIRKGPAVSTGARLALAFMGGAIMVYGARMARGCTSGQALSGGALLSTGSWAMMFAVFAGAYAFAYFVRREWN